MFNNKSDDSKLSELKKAEELYRKVIQKSLEHFAGPSFKEEVSQARIEFFENAGVLDENALNYDLRISQFFDWYFFSRELRSFGQTPLSSLFNTRELRFEPEEIVAIDKLKSHRHSIFEYIKTKGNDVYLKDLLKNDKVIVKESGFANSFHSDELFEVRLLPCQDTWIFTKGFCFHPLDAKKYILSEVKRHRKDSDLNPEVMILNLIKMRYRADRYRHVKINEIYSTKSL